MPTRKATASWEGTLKTGRGTLKTEAGLAGNYTFRTRFENEPGTNPEELLAAAEATCFTMALSNNIEKAGKTPLRLDTEASCTIEPNGSGFRISGIKLLVRGAIPGMDAATFQQVAAETRNTCPVSMALKGGLRIDVETKLM